MKSRKGRKEGDDAERRDQTDADGPASYLAGDVMEEYATGTAGDESVDRRGLLKRGALLAGLAGLGAAELKSQPRPKKTMRQRSPPVWSLWWMKFKWRRSAPAPRWVAATPANACTPACCFTPAEPCTALCQTPGDACTQSCIMVPDPPPVDTTAPQSPGDICTPGCVTEGSIDTCTSGCVTEGSIDICTPGCAP